MLLRPRTHPLVCLPLFVLAAAGCGGAPPKEASPADAAATRSAIEERNRAFMEAFSRDDTTAITAMYTEDGALLPPNADFQRGHAAIAAFWGPMLTPEIKELVLETDEVLAHGDHASEVGRWTLTKPDGSPLDRGKYIVIWMRVDGGWKLHRDMWSSSEAPPAVP